MKTILFVLLLSLVSIELSAQEIDQITQHRYTLHSESLESDVEIVMYDPYDLGQEDSVTVVFYVFGDFFFFPFAGSVHYLHAQQSIIPKTVLVGINEIPGREIGSHIEEYAEFITGELIEEMSGRYNLAQDCVLFGHSRATHLVAEVVFRDPSHITNYVLSAPWLNERHRAELEVVLDSRDSAPISFFIAQSEEDMGVDDIRNANEALLQLLDRYETGVTSRYRHFEGEIHMSIPPLSFYYGIKHLLGS